MREILGKAKTVRELLKGVKDSIDEHTPAMEALYEGRPIDFTDRAESI
jgi:hypothetical protein